MISWKIIGMYVRVLRGAHKAGGGGGGRAEETGGLLDYPYVKFTALFPVIRLQFALSCANHDTHEIEYLITNEVCFNYSCENTVWGRREGGGNATM